MKTFTGISVAPGLVIGKALLFLEDNPEIPRYAIAENQTPAEMKRFVKAVQGAAGEIKLLKENAQDMGREQENLFTAQLLMVEDPDFHYQIKARLESKFENIEWIVWEIARELSQKLARSPDAYLRERAADVTDVSQRIIGQLLGHKRVSLSDLKEDVILAAHNLLPSDALAMDKKRVKALVMDAGSRTCHTAILARAFGIPSVLGLSSITKELNTGDALIVDGEAGTVILDPDAATLARYEEEAVRRGREQGKLKALKKANAETADGRRVVLNANIELPEEAEGILESGAEGIGLYRSEFLFMTPGQASEDDQYQAYRTVVRAMGKRPVTIRTVDVGGDKLLPGFQGEDEMNPLLGWRAIRFSLALPEMFKTQLRAILRASAEGKVKIMFPMISGIEELEEAINVLEEAKAECRRRSQSFDENIEVGTMIEIPAAVMTADILAKKSDFFSIGTNDLIQYTLAIDRGNEKVNYLAQPTHPAVLRFLKQTIDAAHKRGISAAMCGELAGESSVTPLLLGMGLDEFSMIALSIPRIKQIIRGVRFADCEKLAASALACSSYREVDELLKSWRAEYVK